jgi:hypothetical protein
MGAILAYTMMPSLYLASGMIFWLYIVRLQYRQVCAVNQKMHSKWQN